MFSFENDYSEGACPEVLNALIETNYKQCPGYGNDEYCDKAKQLIKKEIGRDDVDIHFIPGGTPANMLATSLIKPYEAIICADNGHINVHETGAIEAHGHKILTSAGKDGKITPEEIEAIACKHTDEHMVKPKMVFISNPSEFGTIYSKKELVEISDVCKKHNFYLYMDGARLSCGLTAETNDVTLSDIASLCDIFYIGGTKNGALLGEAMVIVNDELKPDFRYMLKRNGEMLAKSRVIGTQFMALMDNGVYINNAKNANSMAQQLKAIFEQYGIKMYLESYTNQIFPILDNKLLEKIKEKYVVTIWDKYDENNTVVRFVCSWATKQENIDQFAQDMEEFTK